MDNKKFLKNYHQLQYSIMFDQFKKFNFGLLAICDSDSTPYFNYLYTDQLIDEDDLEEIHSDMQNLDRKSTIYFENSRELKPNTRLLKNNGYKKLWEDTWMFHDGGLNHSNYKAIDTTEIEIIDSEERLEIFLETFDQCYQENDPQNPYGRLGEYLDTSRRVWKFHQDTSRLEYFLVKDGTGKPVAVSTLTNFARIGYISNVGSIREVRGQGYGKIASLFAVQKSTQNGNDFHCLATEEGHYPNEFYKRIGFESKLEAVGYSLSGRD